MKTNNGWYSVYDTEHRPASGQEVLCLGMLDDAMQDESPLADQNNRIYYIATWYNAGDTIYDEDPEPEDDLSPEDRLFHLVAGKGREAREDGFYVRDPELYKRKDTRGGKFEPYDIVFKQRRLHLAGEGSDGLLCWQPLTWPIDD